ncbi:M20 family metallopeptidase [Vibrio tritonius]|uniref:M20 family metallopeptidase n=1 Tax=Vibrio tritonius TaxID=1435069 RepID=UPI00315DC1AE
MSDTNKMMTFVSEWLQEQYEPMRQLLQELVDIDSYSLNEPGRLAVAQRVIKQLTDAGIDAALLTDHETYAVKACVGDPSAAPVVLSGHMDTVFPTGEVLKRPYTEQNGKAMGPGVTDMKAGIVMNCFILQAFHHYQMASGETLPLQLMLLATTDEEIGSPQGRHVIYQHVEGAKAVFNAEPGRISGNVVNARKGGATYTFEVTGRAAHAGVSHQDGISAIGILVDLIQKLHALTDYDAGITTNVGVMSGGTTSNTVAQYASAKLDVRYLTATQGKWLEEKITQCVTAAQRVNSTIVWHKIAGFVPFEEPMSRSLLSLYKEEALALGLIVDGEFTGGCSDAGWTSSMGIPTLCATGPVGGYAHTEREFCDLTTFVPRALIVARCCCAIG